MNFKEEQKEKVEKIEAILREYLPEANGYQSVIMEAMEYSLMAGGKRLRPMLMMETYRLSGGETDVIYPFIAAMEMIHTYSLVHDDLPAMDNDEYRRGRKTTHIVYGEDMGILAGDALLNYAFETACKAFEQFPEESLRIGQALRVLARKAGIYGMIGGQVVDVKESGHQIDEEVLDFIFRLKTGALIESAMMIGAILAGASKEDVKSMQKVAGKIGMAFQIQDDILDVTSTTEQLEIVDDMRMWRIAEACRRGISYDLIHEITKVDEWFIDKFAIITEMETALKTQELTPELLAEAKRIEFPDNVIAQLTGKTEQEIHDMRHANGIVAAYKIVDTCAAEFAAETPYYYSVYGSENEVEQTKDKKKVLVLGSGPIRIGQGIEFDFCSVHCTWAFAKDGYETIIVNNNPETVSTDFDIADKLYFEPLTPEDVESIVDIEKPDGAVVQFGGQTAIKLTEALMKMGVPILGTSAENVDKAEDRELFDEILEECEIPRPTGGTVFTAEERLTRGFTSITQYSNVSGCNAYCTLHPPVMFSSLIIFSADVRSI